jgi:hypothetical protein
VLQLAGVGVAVVVVALAIPSDAAALPGVPPGTR